MYTSTWTEPATGNQAPNIRIVQLDVLRGFAVLGIYWINVVLFAMPAGSYSLPTLIGDATQANLYVWGFSEIFVEGTMRGLFSMLFGASAMVFLDEAKLASSGLEIVDRYYRRTLLLVLFGLIHGYLLLWPYDVLYAYGLLGMFLFPLRKLSAHKLLIFGCLLLLLGDLTIPYDTSDISKPATAGVSDTLVIQHTDSAGKTISTTSDLAEMRDDMQEQAEEDIELFRSGYSRIFLRQIDRVREAQSITMYSAYSFDIGGMMLLGMALLKWGVLAGRHTTRFYLYLMLAGYLVGGAIRGYTAYIDMQFGFDLYKISEQGEIGYNLGRLPITIGHLGVIGLLCKFQFLYKITGILAAVGRLALTNYIMQTFISIFLFYGFGFTLYAEFERYQLVFICLAVWAFQMVFSIAWLHRYKLGPLEWLWRSLIYGKPQPLLKSGPY